MRRFDTYAAKPFVKWVGGKAQLLGDIKKSLPHNLSQWKDATYIEPFVGGGAVLFWILQEYPNITRAIINDINAELICTYRIIKSNVEKLIKILSQFQAKYISLDENARKEYFSSQRERFNARNNSEMDTAALFIFLNHTCFNGLYRVNSKGMFNVPHGKYTNPKIFDETTLRADATILQKVEILCGDFTQTGIYANKHVLYYFDPPYRPLTETSAFTSYSKEGFDDTEQMRLRNFCGQIATKHALFVVSNSDPQNVNNEDNFFDRLYKTYSIKRVSAARMINSKGNGRGSISEIMISNITNTY
ncbi:MAG: DNA adenine methylase [Porphyromonadaceae bacterium]|nr:DNA adenine methylase [Porphyromonadaceae bacterium]